MFMQAYHTTRFYECLKKGIHEYLLTHIVLITMQHMTSQTWNLYQGPLPHKVIFISII